MCRCEAWPAAYQHSESPLWRRQGADVEYVAVPDVPQVWDLAQQVASLAEQKQHETQLAPQKQAPMQLFGGHSTEGFAMDWSPLVAGRLLTGDCKDEIYCWERGEGGKWAISGPLRGHTSSVEDIQWSPTESNVFASCSADRTVRIWDVRDPANSKPVLTVNSHSADVIVISWIR